MAGTVQSVGREPPQWFDSDALQYDGFGRRAAALVHHAAVTYKAQSWDEQNCPCRQGVLLEVGSKRLPSYKVLGAEIRRKQEDKASSKKSLLKPSSRRTPCGHGRSFLS